MKIYGETNGQDNLRAKHTKFFLLHSPRVVVSNASTLSSMLASPLPRFWDVMLYAWSLVSLFFWSICLSSSLVHFEKGPEYLTRDTAQVFIPLIRFLLDNFVSNSFLVLLWYTFLIFSFISTCLMVSASKIIIIAIIIIIILYLSIFIYFET